MSARRRQPPPLAAVLDAIEARLGRPPALPPRKALDWVLWENAAYLVPDEKRAAAYAVLAKRTRLSAAGILALPRAELRSIAALGGMMPEKRVEKLLAIATTVDERFDGDLEAVLARPLPEARKALKLFPGIAAPGADRILLFTRAHPLPALESNGLRSLCRLGLAREGKAYAATYRAGIAALEPLEGCDALIRAYELLRRHGQELCKSSAPLCDACPLDAVCPSAE